MVGPERAMKLFLMMNGRLRLSSTQASTLTPPNTSISSSGKVTAPRTTHGSRRATSPTAWISFVNSMLSPSQERRKSQKVTLAACREQNHRAAGEPEAEPLGTHSSRFHRRRRESVRYRGQEKQACVCWPSAVAWFLKLRLFTGMLPPRAMRGDRKWRLARHARLRW